MKQNDSLSVQRNRSIQAVVSDGYKLYLGNIWKLIRSSWIQAVIYAIALGASMTYFFSSLLPTLMGHSGTLMAEIGIWLATVVIFILAMLVFAFAGGVVPLQEHYKSGHIRSTLHWYGRWPWRFTLRGICKIPGMLLKMVRCRQLGLLTATILVMLLVVLIATLVLQLPAIILALSNLKAQGIAGIGAAASLPENITQMNFITFTVCGLVQAFIHLSTLFPIYYIWRNACLYKNDTIKKKTEK